MPIWAHHTAIAGSVGHSSSAVRPDGKVIVTVSAYGGAPRIIRFW